ncbi:hypothetical protein BDQ17DRAFT_827218 [Cyathus striatus]|nr:hypothetical protein BDQ17DRAFT_827218 [Cyathus striatus]
MTKLLKMELELLSQLYPHPRIRQVFGIFKCNDATGLVFHDDGKHRRSAEYMLSLRPLQRAAFSIKYIREFVDTYKYLEPYIAYHMSRYSVPLMLGTVTDQVQLRSGERSLPSGNCSVAIIDFYVRPSGRLNTVLSIYKYNHYQDMRYGWNTKRPPGNLSQSELEIIIKILNEDNIISQPHVSITQLISKWISTYHSVMKTIHISRDIAKKNECILGHPVIVWPHYSNRIHYISGHFDNIQQNPRSNFWLLQRDLFCGKRLRISQFTCFKLKTNPITLATFRSADYQNISFHGNCRLSSDAYRDWLYAAPKVLENHAFIHDASNNLGIVSQVEIQIGITVLVSRLIHYVEDNRDTEVICSFPTQALTQ